MDELTISGKRFISSRRVAKENGYHTDYIGQLIRSGKLVGQKVGRSWYVEAVSLDAFLGKETAAEVSVEEAATETAGISEVSDSAVMSDESSAVSTTEVTEDAPETDEIPVAVSHSDSEPAEELVIANASENTDSPKIESLAVAADVSAEDAQEDEHEQSVEEERAVPVTIASVKKQAGLSYSHPEVERLPTISKPESQLIYRKDIAKDTTRTHGIFSRIFALAVIGAFAFLCAGAASFAFDYRIAVEGNSMSASVSLIEAR